MNDRTLLIALVAAGALGLALACQPPAPVPTAAVQPTSPPGGTAAAKATEPSKIQAPVTPTGTLKVGITRQAPVLDALAMVTGNAGQEPGGAMSEKLLDFDGRTTTIVGALAESWSVAADNRTWTLKLRPGVRFWNGDPLTAQDVKFSYETFMNPANRYSNFFRLQPFIAEIRTPDAQTVQMVTRSVDGLFAARLTYLPIIQEKSYTTITPQNFATQAVQATGPFMFKARDGDRVTLEANPNAWRTPRLRNVEVVGLLEVAVRLAALKTGEIDLAASVLPESVADLRAEGRTVVTVPNFAQSVVLVDSASPDAVPATRDRRVREALSISLDRPAFVRSLSSDLGKPGYQAVPEEANGYNPALPPIRQDLARARQLVRESGFEGTTLKMSGVFTAGLTSLTGAQAIAQQLSQSGIRVEIETLELSVFLGRYNNGGATPLMLFPLGSAHRDADGAIQNFRDETNTARPQVRYSNPAFDRAYLASLAETDPARRLPLLREAVKILYDDWAVIPVGSVPGIFALNRKVQNFNPGDQFTWNWTEIAVQ